MDAQVVGTLIVGPGGCFALDYESTITPVVWPKGSTLADDGQSVEISRSGPTVRIGDDIEGGGGEFTSPHESTTYRDVPDECLTDYDAVVVLTSWKRIEG
jgi:hypothetical protein